MRRQCGQSEGIVSWYFHGLESLQSASAGDHDDERYVYDGSGMRMVKRTRRRAAIPIWKKVAHQYSVASHFPWQKPDIFEEVESQEELATSGIKCHTKFDITENDARREHRFELRGAYGLSSEHKQIFE